MRYNKGKKMDYREVFNIKHLISEGIGLHFYKQLVFLVRTSRHANLRIVEYFRL